MREARAPAGGQLPVLALDVVNDGGARPGKQGRHNQADALARAGRSKTHDMFRAVVPKISAIKTAKHDAVEPKKSGRA